MVRIREESNQSHQSEQSVPIFWLDPSASLGMTENWINWLDSPSRAKSLTGGDDSDRVRALGGPVIFRDIKPPAP